MGCVAAMKSIGHAPLCPHHVPEGGQSAEGGREGGRGEGREGGRERGREGGRGVREGGRESGREGGELGGHLQLVSELGTCLMPRNALQRLTNASPTRHRVPLPPSPTPAGTRIKHTHIHTHTHKHTHTHVYVYDLAPYTANGALLNLRPV